MVTPTIEYVAVNCNKGIREHFKHTSVFVHFEICTQE